MKTIITSNIMRKAHYNTKVMKKQFPEVNYRSQLGLEISNLLKLEKINYKKRIVKVKLLNEMKKIIVHGNYISGDEITNLENMLRRETRLNRLYFPRPMTVWDLAEYLVNEHFDKVRFI